MPRNVRLLIKCRVCEVLVTNLNQHMLQKHPAAPVTRDQLEQLGQNSRVGLSEEGATGNNGCQMAIAIFLDCMCLALRA